MGVCPTTYQQLYTALGFKHFLGVMPLLNMYHTILTVTGSTKAQDVCAQCFRKSYSNLHQSLKLDLNGCGRLASRYKPILFHIHNNVSQIECNVFRNAFCNQNMCNPFIHICTLMYPYHG